jgi:hypothetical protein
MSANNLRMMVVHWHHHCPRWKPLAVCLLALGMVGLAAIGQAAPPAYVILRRVEAPGKHGQPGHPDAALVEARTCGYAYGYFGAAPRAHASRHFGFYRTYTQWSTW